MRDLNPLVQYLVVLFMYLTSTQYSNVPNKHAGKGMDQ